MFLTTFLYGLHSLFYCSGHSGCTTLTVTECWIPGRRSRWSLTSSPWSGPPPPGRVWRWRAPPGRYLRKLTWTGTGSSHSQSSSPHVWSTARSGGSSSSLYNSHNILTESKYMNIYLVIIKLI